MPKGKGPRGKRGGRKFLETGPVKEQESAMEKDENRSHETVDMIELVESEASSEDCTVEGLVDDDISSLKIPKTAHTLECSVDVKNNTGTDGEKIDTEKNVGGCQEIIIEKCLTTMDKIHAAKETSENTSSQGEGDIIHEVKDISGNQETEVFISEQQEAKLLKTVVESGGTEEMETEMNFVNAELDDQQKEDSVQSISKRSNEDQHLLDVTENADIKKDNAASSIELKKANAASSIELQKQNETEETGNSVNSYVNNNTVAADLITPYVFESQQVEDLGNNKFEEISEGSIEQAEQDDLMAESFSDVEITGESFEPKKVQNSKNSSFVKGKATMSYKGTKSLEALFFAAENDDVKITAEDKGNDDISDTSLSDHMDAELSLEEISDDDLEPSKKRRKSSGQTPVKTGNDVNEGEDTKPDNMESECRSDETSEKVKFDKIDMKVQKRIACDDTGDSPNSNKRHKFSGEKNDTEVVSSDGEKETKKEKKIMLSEGVDISYGRNVVLNKRNLAESSRKWKQESSERSLSSKDFVRRKYNLVDSSCQSEPQLLKGKIVQCSINPVKLRKEKSTECDSTFSEFVKKFKESLPSGVSYEVLSDATYLQPPQNKGTYSFSIGPLVLSDVVSSAFKDDFLSASENFSLIFDNHCQGIFKAAFSKHENVASLFTWLNHRELNNPLVVSVLGCEENTHVCKAILLFVNEQGIQTENQLMINDEENKSKLYLNGVPKDVSTAFIHLLFPEAQNVVTDADASNGVVTLDFSCAKKVDDILSSYGLLVINGCQVFLSRTKSQEDQENVILSADASKEPDIIVKDCMEIENEQLERHNKVCTNFEQGAKSDTQQKDITINLESEGSEEKSNQVIQKEIAGDLGKCVLPGNIDSLAEDSTLDIGGGDKNVSEMYATDSRLAVTDTAEVINAADVANIKEQSPEMTGLRDENITSENAFEVNKSKKQAAELLDESAADSGDKGNKDNSPRKVVTEEANKLETEETTKLKTSMHDNKLPKKQLLTDKEVECEAGLSVQGSDNISTVKETQNMVGDNMCFKASDKEVNDDVTEAGQKTNGENFEDVSDEEMINQIKDLDEVILRKDSMKTGVANVDLTNESDDSVKIMNNESIEKPSEGGDKKSDNQCRVCAGTKAEEPSGRGECMDSKLVMTDGDLEVTMEVIDVNNDSGGVNKVIYPRTWHISHDTTVRANHCYLMTRRENTGVYSSYASKSGPQDPYRDYPSEIHASGTSKHHYSWSSRRQSPSYRGPFIESAAQKRDSFPPKHRRSCSPSPRRYMDLHRHSYNYASDHHRTSSTEQWSKGFGSRHPGLYRDTGKVDSYSKPVSETKGRPRDKKSQSHSLSDMSESSKNQMPALRKSPYTRGSQKQPGLHTSRSPISISSRSHTLSPVSKSSSLDLSEPGVEKEELVKTVEHILKIAKGIQQTRKRRHDYSKNYRPSSSRRSPLKSRSPYTKRSRNPQSANSRASRSPTHARSARYNYKRSRSPVSYGESSKRRYEEKLSEREHPRDGDKLKHYESERSRRSGQYSYEQSSRSVSGKWPERKCTDHYRTSSDQPWQQSYQAQNYGAVSTSNLYNPSFPPPVCPPPEVLSSIYPASSMPVYQYNSQSHYNYSTMPPSVPPPYVQTALPPPPSFTQPYQPFSGYQPRF